MWQYGDYFPNECRKRAYERILQSLGLCSTRLGLFTASPAVEAHLVLQERARSDLSNAVESLTGREREILILIARGLSNGEIAMELSITERTTAKCVSVILGKLQLVNRTQAALFAIREGLT
jgi:DNA-binding NarL/FixJ family response regulator